MIGPAQPQTGSEQIGYTHDNSSWIGGEWTLVMWLSPFSSQSSAHILRLASSLSLNVQRFNTGQFQVGLSGTVGGSGSSLAVRPSSRTINNGDLILLTAHYDGAGTLTVRWRSDSGGSSTSRSQTTADFVPNTSSSVLFFTPSTGSTFDGAAAFLIREGEVDNTAFNLLWSRRRFTDPFWGDFHGNNIFGGAIPGPTDNAGTTPLILAMGFMQAATPGNGGVGSTSPAFPGLAIAADNTIVYDRTHATGPASLIAARTVSISGDLEYFDPFTVIDDFNFNPPGIFSGDQQVAGYAPLTRLLADEELPDGIKRLVCTGNSRAVRASSTSVSSSGAFFFGLRAIRTSVIAGVSCYRGDAVGAAAVSRGTVKTGGAAGTGNFTRLFTGGSSLNPGPGAPYHLTAEGHKMDVVFGEFAGSQFLSSSPIVCRAIVAKLPSGPRLKYRAVTASTSGGARTPVGDDQSVELDNATAQAIVVSVSGTTTVVDGDVTGSVNVGDLIACVTGSSTGGLNQVEAMVYDEGDDETTITTRFNWDTAPAASDGLRFGPLEYAVLEVEHAGDAANFRGIEVEYDATSSPPLPVSIGQWQAEVSGGDGFAIGAWGCGGAGWTPQIDESFAGALGALAAALGIDLSMDFPSQQDTVASTGLANWLDAMKADSPDLEQVLCGDCRHPQLSQLDSTGYTAFHSAMRSAATSRGLAFATIIEDDTIPSGIDAQARGWIDDTTHPNVHMNEAMLGALLVKFQTAALDEAPAPAPALGGLISRNFRSRDFRSR